ncbi:MarR family winged helix-turn-helix transcriptional regulator [Brevibacterium samyangense]|uniref:MarR family winged helix-turn-helix transcriptional regulator n=1 Tax=Brevibacterium samyangense TaxID=366888 RepID=A0ABN2TH49_9MICO
MTQARWLTPVEREAWLATLAFVETVPAVVDAHLRREWGLTRYEYYVLAMLSEVDGGVRPMSDLASLTNGSLSRLSHAVGKLEKRGLVSRYPKPEDRRTTLVELSEGGRALIVEAAPSHVEEVRRIVFDRIAADQVEPFTRMLRAVVECDDDTACVDEAIGRSLTEE